MPPAVRTVEDTGILAIIDERTLHRECLAQSLLAHGLNMEIGLFGSVDEWRRLRTPQHVGILLNVTGDALNGERLTRDVRRFVSEFPDTPVVILAENFDIAQMVTALEAGAKGYISSEIGLSVCVSAISLALAGGVFISAESLIDLRRLLVMAEDKERRKAAMFTQREADVIDALTQGKPNKIIAYELNLQESTVKVHIRKIMKKLNAKNRTEVTFKIANMFNH